MLKPSKTYALTYNQGKSCKHCDTPLADQEHKGRKYCETIVLEDGSVQSCHDDYHSQRKSQQEAPYREKTAFQKKMHRAITVLYQTFGPKELPVEQLNLYGIDLSRALCHESKGERLFNFYFIGFRLEQLSIFTFKIHSL